MALKARLPSLDGVPESLHGEYTKVGNEFVLTVEGMVPKERLDEFRENNIKFKQERDELAARYDGIDPEEARKLLDRASKTRDKQLIEAGKVDELVAERVTAVKAEHDKALKLLADDKTRITAQLEGLVIDGAIRDAAARSGARPEAIDDFLHRGRSLFKLQDGKAVPMENDKPIYSSKTGAPMDIPEWVSGLTEKAPHLFIPSTGGGSKSATTTTTVAGAIQRGDNAAFLANIDKIAKGEVKVA